jgi:hypothetical protein
MKTNISLQAGESIQVNGTVTVIRCGTHEEGGRPAVPVVDLEVETTDAPVVDPPADETHDDSPTE